VLKEHWDSTAFAPYRAAFPTEFQDSASAFLQHVQSLSASDIKDPALKKLQGFLWRTGYQSGAITTPLFPDVTSQLKSWRQSNGLTLAIFSSGSVEAQNLFFTYICTHTATGAEHEQITTQQTEDLNPLFSANFDTVNAGPKMEKESYEKIAGEMGKRVVEVLFLSDNVNGKDLEVSTTSDHSSSADERTEIRAAKESGMQALVVDREGNAPLSDADREEFTIIPSLDEIVVKI
jgi:enolase-phosphatase E1